MPEFIKSKVRIFETVLERLARILASVYNIQVIFRHDCCMTNGRQIFLPVIPENASDEFLAAVQGFLDHEVGHILFSNFDAIGRIEAASKKLWTIFQSLEDGRIEFLMRQLWRGAGVNLGNCNEWALRQLKEQWDTLTPFGKFCQGLAVLGCDGEDHWFAQEVLKSDPTLWAQLEQVKDLVATAKSLPDSDAVVDLGRKIMATLNVEEENEAPKQEEEGQQSEEENTTPSPSPSGEEGKPTPGPTGSEDEGEEPGPNPFGGLSDEQLKKDDEVRSRHKMLQGYCKQRVEAEDRYLIYTTEGDVIESITHGDKVATAKFLKETRAMVNVLLKKMRLNLLSFAQSKWATDKRRGKIDPSAIFRVSVGTSKRVFRKRIEAPSFDTRCSLWIDHSGSMQYRKLELAARAALLFGEVLNELGIPFEVCGYSTTDYETGQRRFDRASEAEQRVFTRWGNLWVGVYKSFDDDWRNCRHRVYAMTHNQKHNTYDGESVRMAAARLAQHPEKRKVLFVFNDGCPCPNIQDHMPQHAKYLKEIAPQVEKKVELFAVGIMSESVSEFYSNSVMIRSLDDLPKVMLTQLDSMLRKGKTLIKRRAA